MQKRITLLLLLTLALPLFPQTDNTTSKAADVSKRYEAENEKWRINITLFILKSDTAKLAATLTAMKKFTSTTKSYIDLKRKGKEDALKLYYLNLENIKKIEQLNKILAEIKKNYPNYTKDFMNKYKITDKDFEDYDKFEKAYEKTMDRWRNEYEIAMKADKANDIQQLREDMKLLHLAIKAFTLFPGKSATKVPNLQKLADTLRHAIVMLKMHEDIIKQKKQKPKSDK